MMDYLMSLLFGCLHSRTTFPLSVIRNGAPGQPYVCCLDCGREFVYDWHEMRIAGAIPKRAVIPMPAVVRGPEEAA